MCGLSQVLSVAAVPHFFALLGSYLKSGFSLLIDVLPELLNIVLVFVGIFLSFPAFAERVEKNNAARRTVSIVCIVLGVLGFVVSVRQRHESTTQMKTLVTNTNTLVLNTNRLVDQVTILSPQVAEANAKLSSLKDQRRAAVVARDPQLVARLQTQVVEAEKRANEASRNLALTVFPKVLEALGNAQTKYFVTMKKGIQGKYENEMLRATEERRHEINRLMERESAGARQEFEQEVRVVLPTVDYLLQNLLKGLPQTDEDKAEAAVVSSALAGGNLAIPQIDQLIVYLFRLSNRFIPGTPVGLSATIQ